RVERARGLLPSDRDRGGDALAQERRPDADDVGVREEAVQKARDIVEGLGASELEKEDRALRHRAQSVREKTGLSALAARYASNGIARLRRNTRPSPVARTSSFESWTRPSATMGASFARAGANVASKSMPNRASISFLTTTPWQRRLLMTVRRSSSSAVR